MVIKWTKGQNVRVYVFVWVEQCVRERWYKERLKCSRGRDSMGEVERVSTDAACVFVCVCVCMFVCVCALMGEHGRHRKKETKKERLRSVHGRQSQLMIWCVCACVCVC